MDNEESGIYFLNTEQGIINKVATFNESIRNLVWSPDGDSILFELRNKDNVIKLCLLDVRSRKVIMIQEGGLDGKFFKYKAFWSPDSKYFAYLTAPSENKYILNIKNLGPGHMEIEIPALMDSMVWIESE